MKNSLLNSLFALVPVFAWPQGVDTVITRFYLDTIRADSFFLVREDSVFSAQRPRPDVFKTFTLFRDTFDFRQYITNERSVFTSIDRQRIEVAKRYNQATYFIARLECLMDSVFYGQACTGIGARSVLPPPMPDEAPVQQNINDAKGKGIIQPIRQRRRKN